MQYLASKLISAETQALIKHGILTEGLELTNKGTRLLLSFMFEASADKLMAYCKRQDELHGEGGCSNCSAPVEG